MRLDLAQGAADAIVISASARHMTAPSSMAGVVFGPATVGERLLDAVTRTFGAPISSHALQDATLGGRVLRADLQPHALQALQTLVKDIPGELTDDAIRGRAGELLRSFVRTPMERATTDDFRVVALIDALPEGLRPDSLQANTHAKAAAETVATGTPHALGADVVRTERTILQTWARTHDIAMNPEVTRDSLVTELEAVFGRSNRTITDSDLERFADIDRLPLTSPKRPDIPMPLRDRSRLRTPDSYGHPIDQQRAHAEINQIRTWAASQTSVRDTRLLDAIRSGKAISSSDIAMIDAARLEREVPAHSVLAALKPSLADNALTQIGAGDLTPRFTLARATLDRIEGVNGATRAKAERMLDDQITWAKSWDVPGQWRTWPDGNRPSAGGLQEQLSKVIDQAR